MVLLPKRTKYRKQQKGKQTGLSKGGNFIEFGEFGMQALGRGRISAQQIEACRVAINRHFKRRGKVWIRIFPDKPISKKPAETRMGKGKGAVEYWSSVVRPGRVLFEVGNVSRQEAQDALRRAAAKIAIRTRFVERVEKV
jgi:large subunit ribosomal protein L16